MTKDEALYLALDWFKCYQDKSMSRNNAEELADEVIVSIKAALEAKDEPVGWAEHGVINWLADKQFNHTSFLYATPSQRTWVGLKDDDEINWDGVDIKSFVKAIEAKLKEKNT